MLSLLHVVLSHSIPTNFCCFRSQYEEAAERRQGINKAVASDVQEVFRGKSADQLAELQKQIEKKLRERLVMAGVCFTRGVKYQTISVRSDGPTI